MEPYPTTYQFVDIGLNLAGVAQTPKLIETIFDEIVERLEEDGIASRVRIGIADDIDRIYVLPHGCDWDNHENWVAISEFGNDRGDWRKIHRIISDAVSDAINDNTLPF